MRLATLFSAVMLASPLLATPGFAQNAAPLTYVQLLSPQSVQAVQDRLRQAGSYGGAVDGVWGPDSAAALQQYQQAHQLQVTGQMNQATAATLGIDPATVAALGLAPDALSYR